MCKCFFVAYEKRNSWNWTVSSVSPGRSVDIDPWKMYLIFIGRISRTTWFMTQSWMLWYDKLFVVGNYYYNCLITTLSWQRKLVYFTCKRWSWSIIKIIRMPYVPLSAYNFRYVSPSLQSFCPLLLSFPLKTTLMHSTRVTVGGCDLP